MKRKDALIILIPSLIVVILWVVFSVYHNYINSTIPSDINLQISSINPDFDTNAINQIKNRKTVTPIYTIEGSKTSSKDSDQQSSPTPTIISPTTSSSSAKIATNGGALEP